MERKHFIHKYYKGSNLSTRVTLKNSQEGVIEAIRKNMEDGIRLKALVKDLSAYTTQEDVRKSVREIESQAREVIGGDTVDYKAFKTNVQAVRQDIETYLTRYSPEKRPEMKLQKAYLRVLIQAEKLNEVGLDKAIDRAVQKKFESNAFRLASTEINKAYNQESYNRALDDEDCVAVKIVMSTSEGNCEDCQEIAEQDNGAGVGIYSLDDCPVVPVHPHCRCSVIPQYKLKPGSELETSDIEGDRMDEEDY
jgi:hypothetical protein